MPDSLQRVLRMRERLVEEARLGLAACLRAEAECLAIVAGLEAQARRDQEEAAMLMNEDPWLATVAARGREALQARHAAAREAVEQAVAATADARGRVAAARTQAEAVLTLITNRRAAEVARLEQQAQHALADLVLAQAQRAGNDAPDQPLAT